MTHGSAGSGWVVAWQRMDVLVLDQRCTIVRQSLEQTLGPDTGPRLSQGLSHKTPASIIVRALWSAATGVNSSCIGPGMVWDVDVHVL